jgi:hypothetical protein
LKRDISRAELIRRIKEKINCGKETEKWGQATFLIYENKGMEIIKFV